MNYIKGRYLSKKKKTDKIFITFIIIYLLFMSARALFNPFITVYLQEKGFGAEKIGLIMGANSLVLIIAQPFWGIISDKLRSVKLTLVLCMVFSLHRRGRFLIPGVLKV